MAVTPKDLFNLALERHREQWNWTLQFAALWGACLTLLFHSYLLLATSLILFGAGFYQLNMPPMPDNWWARFVHRGIEWEKNWIAAPWNRIKWGWFLFSLALSCLLVWALWTRDLAILMLFPIFGYLWRVKTQNQEGGIDP